MRTKANAISMAQLRSAQRRHLWVASLLLVAVLLLGGCASSTLNLQSLSATRSTSLAPASMADVIEPVSAYQPPPTLATPTPTAASGEEKERSLVTINTQGVRVNLRSGPGTTFAILVKANPGESYELLGKSDDGRWLQVALPPSRDGATTAKDAWVSADLVRTGGSAANVPVTVNEILLEPDLQAAWNVDWSCNSDRCDVKQCSADVTAQVNRQPTGGFLPVEHTVTWADECFNSDAWTFEVDQVTGVERSGEADDNFLYGYWLGAKPGAANGVYPVDETRGVVVYCSGPNEVEIEEGGGWTTVYEGSTCHDTATGMLVYMNYSKRWLFSGDFEGRTYERAYFGDSEKLEQRLTETNAGLAFVIKK